MEVKIGLDTSANLKLECIQFSNTTGNPAFLPDAMICVCSSLGDVLHDPPYITLLANRS